MPEQTTTNNIYTLSVEQRRYELRRAVGERLRIARKELGWSREFAGQQMPGQPVSRTLLSYEQGSRDLSISRLVEYSQVLDEDPPGILSCALVRVGMLTELTLYVNATDIARDLTSEFSRAQSWARRRSRQYPNETTVRLDPTAIRELAVVLEYEFIALSAYFYQFSDRNPDPGRNVPMKRLTMTRSPRC